VSDKNLFGNPEGKIAIKKVTPDALGHLKTHGLFRGILHKTVTNWLPEDLDAFYAVQIHESCLEAAGGASPGSDSSDPGELDYQDFKLDEVLHKFNGPALRQTKAQGGRGTYEFARDTDGIDYTKVDPRTPHRGLSPALCISNAGACPKSASATFRTCTSMRARSSWPEAQRV
jgi:hypothetical protein